MRDEDKKVEFDYIPMGYMPICTMQDGEIYGYEALMRPTGFTPYEMIQMYKQKNELHRLEVSTFVNAITQFKEKELQGMLFINSFPKEIFTRAEMKFIENLMHPDLYGKIVIEILECEHNDIDYLQLKKKLENLRFFENMYIAIDDLGANEDSYDFLNFVRPHIVKIDRDYISNIDQDSQKKGMLAFILSYLHHKNYIILAEGIETENERDYLMDKGIHFAQGYLYGKALVDDKDIIK